MLILVAVVPVLILAKGCVHFWSLSQGLLAGPMSKSQHTQHSLSWLPEGLFYPLQTNIYSELYSVMK